MASNWRSWGRRPHFRFRGLLTTAEIERWIFWVHQWLMWPSSDFLDTLNGPLIPGTSGFYGNWIKDVRAGQFIVLGDFVDRCLVRRCTCLCGSAAQCFQCVILHRCRVQWHPRQLACLWTMRSVCCRLGVSQFAESNSTAKTGQLKNRILLATSQDFIRNTFLEAKLLTWELLKVLTL